MKRYHFPRKILAAALCFSLLLSASSCKKKTAQRMSERDILERDPFFESEVFEVKFPLDETKVLEYMSVEDIQILNDKVIANYIIQYEFPEADASGIYSEGIDWNAYSKQGTAMFSLEGEYLGDMKAFEGEFTECTAIDQDGNMAALMMTHNDRYEVDGMKVIFRDDSGNTIKEMPLAIPPNSGLNYVMMLQFLPDGKIALQSTYSTPVYVYDENGKYLYELSTMDRGICGEIFQQDGKFYAFTMPTDWFGTIDYYVHEIDLNTGEMKPGKKTDGIVDVSTLTYAEDGVYSSTPNGILKYNPVTAEMEEVFDWNQTDVNHSLLTSVKSYPVNENEMHAIARRFGEKFIDDTYYVINLKRAKKNPHAGKKILYVGGLGLTDGFYDYMYSYNADTSHECRIEAFDYSYSFEDGTSLDEQFYTNITNRINLMLISGEAPDILVNFAGYDQYANDAMLVDLNTYIDGTNGFNRSEYFDNIFRSMEVNGKLYYIPMSFALKGYMTNTQYLDVDTNWTFDDLDREAAALPDGMLLIPPTESTDLLKLFMGSDLTTYMDYANKKVNFNSEGMVRVFEEVKKYSAKEDLSDRNFMMGVSSTSSYGGLKIYDLSDFSFFDTKPVFKICDYLHNGTSAMISVDVDDLNDYSLYQGLVEGKGKLVGYPTLKGNGILAQPGESMAIFAGSPYKDQAWEVIRSFFSEEAQMDITMGTGRGFPLRISAFDKKMESEVEKIGKGYEAFQKDLAKGMVFETILYPVEDGQVEELRAIIDNVKCSYHTDEAVMSVILEEAPGYFQDSRSAEDVLKNIDNRALLIVQER